MLKSSMDLPRLLWLYVLILHTPFYFHPEDLVITLRNQDNKVAFIRVDEDGALARSSEFMKTFHKINNIVQTTS